METSTLERIVDIAIKNSSKPPHRTDFFQTRGLPYNEKQVGKYVWILQNVGNPVNYNSTTTGYFKLDGKVGGREVEMQVTVEGLEVTSPARQMLFTVYSKHRIHGVVSRIQVIGNSDYRKFSDLVDCKSYASCSYTFDNPEELTLSKDKIIPSLKVEGKDIKDVLVVIIDFVRTELKYTTPGAYEHEDAALMMLKRMYDEKLFADVEIQVLNPDGTEHDKIMAHKVVLASRSDAFEAMLKSKMKENTDETTAKISLIDFEPDTIHELLKYLYLGEADLEVYSLELLKCSDKYNIKELVERCEDYIGQNVEKFDWKSLFYLMETYGDRFTTLKNSIKEYFERNESSLKMDPGFQAAVKAFSKQFFEVYFSEYSTTFGLDQLTINNP